MREIQREIRRGGGGGGCGGGGRGQRRPLIVYLRWSLTQMTLTFADCLEKSLTLVDQKSDDGATTEVFPCLHFISWNCCTLVSTFILCLSLLCVSLPLLAR